VAPTNIVGTSFIPKSGEHQLRFPHKVRVHSSPSGFKRRLWKPNKVTKKLLLGSDVGLEETCCMELCGLFGRVSYHYLAQETLQTWMEKSWNPSLGYTPEVLYLAKGWLGFIYRSPEDTNILLASRWVFGGSSLMFKRWRGAFDPATDYFLQRHLWVLLSGLPIHLCNEGALKSIGDALGTFIIVDYKRPFSMNRKRGIL
jgi:hypothetical protein